MNNTTTHNWDDSSSYIFHATTSIKIRKKVVLVTLESQSNKQVQVCEERLLLMFMIKK